MVNDAAMPGNSDCWLPCNLCLANATRVSNSFGFMGTANMIYAGNLTIFFINDLDCGCTAFSWYFPNKGHSHYCKVIAAGLHLVSNPKFNLLRSFLVEIWKNAKVRYYNVVNGTSPS